METGRVVGKIFKPLGSKDWYEG